MGVTYRYMGIPTTSRMIRNAHIFMYVVGEEKENY